MLPKSLWIQGKDDLSTRSYVIEQLRSSKDNVVGIATQQIFNTGIDVKINNLVNAAGGKAEHLIVQRMGRGLRTADDKDILNYYDFIFNINDYLLQHSNKRIKILKKEGHEVIIKETLDFREK
jgi:superfamily II DNA or RNA helicase